MIEHVDFDNKINISTGSIKDIFVLTDILLACANLETLIITYHMSEPQLNLVRLHASENENISIEMYWRMKLN